MPQAQIIYNHKEGLVARRIESRNVEITGLYAIRM
jgi:hypothetical protein